MISSELVMQAKKGNNLAMKWLFDKWAPQAKICCLRYIRNNEDAEETMIDGFCKFFKSIDRFNYTTDGQLWSYIKTVMVNECLVRLRLKTSFTMLPDSAVMETALPDSVFEKLQAGEIFNLVSQLPAGYRTIMNLYAIEGYEHTEIAKALNISESTSRSQLTRARVQLKKILDKQEKHYEEQNSK